MSIPSIDVRLCSDAQCFASLADFTIETGICVSDSSGGASRASLSEFSHASFEKFSGSSNCSTTPDFQIQLNLDGAVHFDGNSSIWYTSQLTQACRMPDPAAPYFGEMTSFSGRGLLDLGNLDECLFRGYQHCSIMDKTTGAYFGACIPYNCGVADMLNSSAPIWSLLLLQFPQWQYIINDGSNADLTVSCGYNPFPVDTGATYTLFALAAAAVIVVFSSFYALAISGSKAKSGGIFPESLDKMLRATSLTTTIPRLLGSAPPARARDESTPRLTALDGVRVLSLSLVVLGHSFFFPFTISGYSNGYAVYNYLGTASFQVIPSAEFAVDSFFALSGLLGAYLLTKGLQKAFRLAMKAEGFGDAAVEAGATKSSDPKSLNNDFTALLLESDVQLEEDRLAEPRPTSAYLRLIARGVAATCGTWLYSIVHRYLRLIPSVGTMIAVFVYVAPLLGSGPLWHTVWPGTVQQCTDHAWASLLFLNNFFPGQHDGVFGNQCAGWLWYLAVDFQLHFIIITPLCAAFAAWAPSGWSLLTAALIGSITLSAYRVTDKSLSFLSLQSNPTLNGDSSDYFYDKPVERAPAFLVGIGAGWALLAWEIRSKIAAAKRQSDSSEEEKSAAPDSPPVDENRSATLRIAAAMLPMRSDGKALDTFATAGLAIALTLIGVLFYAPTGAYQGELGQIQFASLAPPAFQGHSQWTTLQQQAYMIYSRPLWSLGLSILLYFCATNRGGALQAALGASFWKPVATISFGAYLYHPVVLYVLNASVLEKPRFSPAYLATTYAATCVYSCIAAGIMYCIVEAPAAALEKFLVDGLFRTVNSWAQRFTAREPLALSSS
jgi:peptidoglycan/LPS O-acetylase OafA/YrhL